MSDSMLIWELPNTEEEAVSLLQCIDLLPVTRKCQNGHEMHLYFAEGRPFWNCNLRQCRKKLGIRSDTWFVNTRLSFVTIVHFLYCWCEGISSLTWCEEQLGMRYETIVEWNNYVREVCAFNVESRNQGKIGGVNHIVEIDESVFIKRKTYNAGGVLPQQWIFGGLCRETGGCFLVEVPNRSPKTLFEQIVKFVKPGTTIVSDFWTDYNSQQLKRAGFSSLQKKYKYNFIELGSGVPTQYIKRMWGCAVWRKRKQRGTARFHFNINLAEFMWLTTAEHDRFTHLLSDIAKFWAAFQEH